MIKYVSILVFVELALGRGREKRSLGMQGFQSLFSWNSLSDFGIDRIGRTTEMFQSLFSWNSLSDDEELSVIMPKESFNPCFRGTRSRTLALGSRRLVQEYVSILVFVELALGPFSTV